MNTKPRRKRTDSIEAEQRAIENAHAGPRKPPDYLKLRAEARPFWKSIMLSRPRHVWTDVDLGLAANMAQAQADALRLTRALRREGDLIDGKPNPKELMLDRASKRAERIAKLIHVHAAATDCSAQEGQKRANHEREVRERELGEARKDVNDNLIPTLRAVN